MSTFALVHGAWHDASCWELLAPELEARDHTVVAPTLPCDDPDASFADYAQLVARALDGTGDLILVGHSLGADTTALVAAMRPLRLLVYLCPILHGFERPAGVEQPRRYKRVPWPPRDELGRDAWEPGAAIATLYPRLDRALAARMAERLRPQADVFSAPYPSPQPPAVPSAYVLTTDDELLHTDWSRWAARTLIGVEPHELPGGHFPLLERPAELATLLDRLSKPAPH